MYDEIKHLEKQLKLLKDAAKVLEQQHKTRLIIEVIAKELAAVDPALQRRLLSRLQEVFDETPKSTT